MTKNVYLLILAIFLFASKNGNAQIDEDKMGAWCMYFFNTTFKESPWGVQGDVQLRNWNIGGDLNNCCCAEASRINLKRPTLS